MLEPSAVGGARPARRGADAVGQPGVCRWHVAVAAYLPALAQAAPGLGPLDLWYRTGAAGGLAARIRCI